MYRQDGKNALSVLGLCTKGTKTQKKVDKVLTLEKERIVKQRERPKRRIETCTHWHDACLCCHAVKEGAASAQ